MFWMVARSGSRIGRLEGVIRKYQERTGDIETADDLYLETFVAALEEVQRHGLLKRYQERQSDEWRGRPLISETVKRFHAKGYSHRKVFQVFDLTTDILENRILKHTVRRLLQRLEQSRSVESVALAARARRLLVRFGAVKDAGLRNETVARMAPSLIRSLPRSHSFYEPAMWLAYLIAVKGGVELERLGRARFESLVIDVSSVFENYARKLCLEATARHSHFQGCEAVDGNRVPIALFALGTKAEVQPDVYFTRRNDVVAVADAKYKDGPSRGDRYEMLAFCEAAQVRRAAFICPFTPDSQPVEHYGTTPGGLVIHVVRLNLNAKDMGREESEFLDRLSAVLVPAEASEAA
jgi:5-methylcytosine-specific restriction endonuclease McrBC regulatory subunit McrC